MESSQEEIAALIELSIDADQEAIAKLVVHCEQSPELKQQIRDQVHIAGLLDAQLSCKEADLLDHVMQNLDKSTESACERTAAQISERIRALPAHQRASIPSRRKIRPFALACLATAAALLLVLLNVFGAEVQTQVGPTIIAMDNTLLRVNDERVIGHSVLATGSAVSVESGQAVIHLNDGSSIELFGPTIMHFHNEPHKVCHLDSGHIAVQVKPQLDGNAFIITTTHALVQVVGTMFDVRVEDDVSFLKVNEGTVEFTDLKTNKHFTCNAGESVDSGDMRKDGVASKVSSIVATADTYVPHNAGEFQEKTVKGQLRVKYTRGDGPQTRHSFLRFPLPNTIDQVKTVRLQLCVTTVDDGIADHVLEYVEDNWNENTLDWDNQPRVLSNARLARWTVRERGTLEILIDPEFLKGRKILSLRIRSVTHRPFVTYVSRESPRPEQVPPTLKLSW